jgi:hypothetical protein
MTRKRPRDTNQLAMSMIDLASWLKSQGGVVIHSASLVAGQAMNRYRETQVEFQFSIVAPQTAHSKLLISRASTICSLRS